MKPTTPFDVHSQWFSDAAPAAPDMASTEVITGDPVYFSNLSPDLRPQVREALRPLQKPNDLAKAYVDLKGKMSRALIVPNAEKPDPEEVRTFRAALDIPEKLEGYTIDSAAFKDIQGVEEVVKMAQERAAKHHMSKAQAQGLFDTVMGLSKAGRDGSLKAQNDAKAAFGPELTRLLGGDEKKAQAAVNLMTQFLTKNIGDQELVDDLTRSGLIFKPKFALKAAALAEQLGEEPIIAGGGRGRGAKPAPRGTQGHYSEQFQAIYGANVKES